jgi:hypothetical protein
VIEVGRRTHQSAPRGMRHHHGLDLLQRITEFRIALLRRRGLFGVEGSPRDNLADDDAATGRPKGLKQVSDVTFETQNGENQDLHQVSD